MKFFKKLRELLVERGTRKNEEASSAKLCGKIGVLMPAPGCVLFSLSS